MILRSRPVAAYRAGTAWLYHIYGEPELENVQKWVCMVVITTQYWPYHLQTACYSPEKASITGMLGLKP